MLRGAVHAPAHHRLAASRGAAAALSVLTIAAVLGLLGVLHALSRRLPAGTLPWA
ncbi:MAG: hypothetical protein AB7S67_00475 [Thiomonas sp.]